MDPEVDDRYIRFRANLMIGVYNMFVRCNDLVMTVNFVKLIVEESKGLDSEVVIPE